MAWKPWISLGSGGKKTWNALSLIHTTQVFSSLKHPRSSKTRYLSNRQQVIQCLVDVCSQALRSLQQNTCEYLWHVKLRSNLTAFAEVCLLFAVLWQIDWAWHYNKCIFLPEVFHLLILSSVDGFRFNSDMTCSIWSTCSSHLLQFKLWEFRIFRALDALRGLWQDSTCQPQLLPWWLRVRPGNDCSNANVNQFTNVALAFRDAWNDVPESLEEENLSSQTCHATRDELLCFYFNWLHHAWQSLDVSN